MTAACYCHVWHRCGPPLSDGSCFFSLRVPTSSPRRCAIECDKPYSFITLTTFGRVPLPVIIMNLYQLHQCRGRVRKALSNLCQSSWAAAHNQNCFRAYRTVHAVFNTAILLLYRPLRGCDTVRALNVPYRGLNFTSLFVFATRHPVFITHI